MESVILSKGLYPLVVIAVCRLPLPCRCLLAATARFECNSAKGRTLIYLLVMPCDARFAICWTRQQRSFSAQRQVPFGLGWLGGPLLWFRIRARVKATVLSASARMTLLPYEEGGKAEDEAQPFKCRLCLELAPGCGRSRNAGPLTHSDTDKTSFPIGLRDSRRPDAIWPGIWLHGAEVNGLIGARRRRLTLSELVFQEMYASWFVPRRTLTPVRLVVTPNFLWVKHGFHFRCSPLRYGARGSFEHDYLSEERQVLGHADVSRHIP